MEVQIAVSGWELRDEKNLMVEKEIKSNEGDEEKEEKEEKSEEK